MGYKFKRKRKIFKTYHIFLILIIFLIAISTSYALFTTQLVINGRVTGNQEQLDVLYINIENSHLCPSTIGYMETYTHTFAIPPTITAITMGENDLTLGTDYTYEEGVLTIPNVTGTLLIQGESEILEGVAQIGETYYPTLQDAIDAVEDDNTETTIKLLTNVNEHITISANQNIIFNLQNYVVLSVSDAAVVENYGTIKITNGTIRTEQPTSAINNNGTGKIIMTGGSIISNGGKAGIYNLSGGVVEISGDAYLKSKATGTYSNLDRGTIQNFSGGIVTIKGGTIEGETEVAVSNKGTLTIGEKGDGIVSTTSPVIIGKTYGVKSLSKFTYYDGIIKGVTKAIFDETKISETETGYNIFHSEESISNLTYKTAYLAISNTVIFDARGGDVSETTRGVETGEEIGTLPIPTKVNNIFLGWFTLADGGEEITSHTIITGDVTYYAHWESTAVAEINGTEYKSLEAAIKAVPKNNTETTIKLLADTSGSFTIAASQNIAFNLQSYTISGVSGKQVFINNGTMKISNGEIRQTGAAAAINNNANGKLIITGGSISSTGGRAAVYNLANGNVEISGNAHLSSTASGSVDGMERGTAQNLANGTMTITGGTIEGTAGPAISNKGILTLGEKDGNISNTSPVAISKTTYGLKNYSTLNFYDGIIKGITNVISGNITAQEDNSQIVDGTETIDGTTYKTAYLELSE